jgi:hypothetical protein
MALPSRSPSDRQSHLAAERRMPSAGRAAASSAISPLAASLTLPSPPPAITRGTPSIAASASEKAP